MGRQEARNRERLVDKRCMSLLKLVGKPRKTHHDIREIKRIEHELVALGAMRYRNKFEIFIGRLKATGNAILKKVKFWR